MGKKLDFIIIAPHGSGIHALYDYLNCISGCACMRGDASYLTRARLEAFLDTDKICGIILDRSDYDNAGYLDFLRTKSSPACLLIELARDPVERLLSVVNTHIIWWANFATGVFAPAAGKTWHFSAEPLYRHGDPQGLTQYVLEKSTMHTATRLFPKISAFSGRRLLLDMEAILPHNANKTIHALAEQLNLNVEGFAPPPALVFSKENRFVHDLSPLLLTLPKLPETAQSRVSAEIRIYPVEFLRSYNMDDQDILCTLDPALVGFSMGKFNGAIAFTFVDRNIPENIKEEFRQHIAKNKDLLRDYCSDLSRRHNFTMQFVPHLLVSPERLSEYAWESQHVCSLLKEYLDSHLSHYRNDWANASPAYDVSCKLLTAIST